MTKAVRVYSYGCPFGATEGAETLATQISLAHRYRNRLTEIERARRDEIVKGRAELPDVVPTEERVRALIAELDAMRKAVKAARARKQKPDAATVASIKTTSSALRQARDELKAIRVALRSDPRATAIFDAANARASAAVKEARSTCGVFWGTYLLVENAMDQVRKAPTPPKFSRWTGDGRIGVQIQGGLTVADLFSGTGSYLRIAPVPEGAYELPRGQRERATRTVAKIRAGSSGPGNREALWVTLPVILHRPLPADGVIKWAWVLRRRIGLKFEYWLQIAVETEMATLPVKSGRSRVAIDLGWRRLPDGGVRVARWRDDAGAEGEVRVPARMLSGMQKVDELRSICDRHLNEIKAMLGAWLAARQSVPEWVTEATKFMAQWRAQARVEALLTQWKTRRFSGDDEVFALLQAWSVKDQHLLAWEANKRDKSLGHRTETYRIFAAQLARKYDAVVLEQFDLRDHAEKPAPEEATAAEGTAFRHLARLSAPGELRSCIVNAAAKYGARVVTVQPQYTTSECSACGFTDETWDAKKEITHTCAKCGVTWDQDDNACQNLLARSAA